MRRLVLASKSPARVRILSDAGFEFEVMETGFGEKMSGEPREIVRQNALGKARIAAKDCPDAIVIGADSIVVLGKEIIGKPRDIPHAIEMLKKLSGSTHVVFTGVAVIDTRAKKEEVRIAETRVTFKRLSARKISEYAATGEPLGKAGGYALQGLGSAIIKEVRGSRTNVMGLPIEIVRKMLAD